MAGKFITIDGCDFTGKSTQIQKIAYSLQEKNIKHVTTREPGGTEFGEDIRSIIMQYGKNIHPYSEFLLFASARCEHINAKIKPMLLEGISIICDRYLASSFVYQGILRNVSHEVIFNLHKTMLWNCVPHITFILDMEPEKILQRMNDSILRGFNSYDSQTICEITKIRNGFLEFAKSNNCIIINADQAEDAVFQEIEKHLYVVLEYNQL